MGNSPRSRRGQSLTDTERARYAHMAASQGAAAVADDLGVAPSTVYGWMQKFGVGHSATPNSAADSLSSTRLDAEPKMSNDQRTDEIVRQLNEGHETLERRFWADWRDESPTPAAKAAT